MIWDGKVYEITTYRVESGSGDHRHPDSLHFSSKIEDDLARRDLTINAMAYHPQRGLLDCFGGQQDLHDRVIRSVGPALLRFEEDALRILRALRFQAVLGFTVEEQTEQAIAQKAPLLDCISVERIWSELQKLLVAPFAHLALQGRREVWQVVLPEWQKAQGQDRLDTLPQDAFLRLIWLCCAADCSPVGAMKRLKCPRQQQRAEALWKLWQQPPQGIYPLRQALRRYGRGLVQDHLALCAAANEIDGQTKEQFARACDGCWSLSQLNINGKKLMDLGLSAGKSGGRVVGAAAGGVFTGPAGKYTGTARTGSQRMAQKEARMMERMFSISQVAQMLGLGIDAVRFYEKKGLVHPQVNSKNRYRMYSFYQIMELLDISYYRSLGLSIEQIHQLYESGDEEQLLCLLREKKRETEKKILYEQQLLKRIEHVGSMTARIRERGGEIDITTFPEGYVLFEQREDSLERYLEQVSSMDNDHFVFCQMVREFAIEQQEGEERLCKVPSRMMLLLDKDTAQQLGEHNEGRKTFPAMRALHSIVRLSNAQTHVEMVEQMCRFAKEQGIRLENRLFMLEIPLISYTDLDHYYAELFIPIIP